MTLLPVVFGGSTCTTNAADTNVAPTKHNTPAKVQALMSLSIFIFSISIKSGGSCATVNHALCFTTSIGSKHIPHRLLPTFEILCDQPIVRGRGLQQ